MLAGERYTEERAVNVFATGVDDGLTNERVGGLAVVATFPSSSCALDLRPLDAAARVRLARNKPSRPQSGPCRVVTATPASVFSLRHLFLYSCLLASLIGIGCLAEVVNVGQFYKVFGWGLVPCIYTITAYQLVSSGWGNGLKHHSTFTCRPIHKARPWPVH